MNPIEFTAEADHAGDRLDRFLTAQIPDFSRSQIQRLIENGHVTHSRYKKVKANSDIREGDAIDLGQVRRVESPTGLTLHRLDDPDWRMILPRAALDDFRNQWLRGPRTSPSA